MIYTKRSNYLDSEALFENGFLEFGHGSSTSLLLKSNFTILSLFERNFISCLYINFNG